VKPPKFPAFCLNAPLTTFYPPQLLPLCPARPISVSSVSCVIFPLDNEYWSFQYSFFCSTLLHVAFPLLVFPATVSSLYPLRLFPLFCSPSYSTEIPCFFPSFLQTVFPSALFRCWFILHFFAPITSFLFPFYFCIPRHPSIAPFLDPFPPPLTWKSSAAWSICYRKPEDQRI